MIEETDIKSLFAPLNIPLYRGRAVIGASVPYLVYNVDYSNNVFADNTTFKKMPAYTLELYNDNPDLTIRENIETILTNNEIPFTSDESDLAAENLFITYYNFGG